MLRLNETSGNVVDQQQFENYCIFLLKVNKLGGREIHLQSPEAVQLITKAVKPKVKMVSFIFSLYYYTYKYSHAHGCTHTCLIICWLLLHRYHICTTYQMYTLTSSPPNAEPLFLPGFLFQFLSPPLSRSLIFENITVFT